MTERSSIPLKVRGRDDVMMVFPDEGALGISRHIFGGHFPLRFIQTRDARALYGKC
jgi:hypothetical protein